MLTIKAHDTPPGATEGPTDALVNDRNDESLPHVHVMTGERPAARIAAASAGRPPALLAQVGNTADAPEQPGPAKPAVQTAPQTMPRPRP